MAATWWVKSVDWRARLNPLRFTGHTSRWLESEYTGKSQRGIQYPEKVKPGNLMYLGVGTMAGIKQIREEKGLSDDEVAALADYLHTLQ